MTDAEAAASAEESINSMFAETVKKETTEQLTQEAQANAKSFDEIRKHGFVTKLDMQQALTQMVAENKKLREEFTALQQLLLKARARGETQIPADHENTKPKLAEIYGDFMR